MLIPCPHCKTDLDITPELLGQTVQCPACNGRLQIPASDATPTASSGKPQRSGWAEKDHANVNFGKSLIIGVAFTIGFLGILFTLIDTGFGAIFLKRGWVN